MCVRVTPCTCGKPVEVNVTSDWFQDSWRAEYQEHLLDPQERRDKARQLRDALDASRLWNVPAKILDVGCGSALTLAALDAPAVLRIGCDIRRELFLRAKVVHTQIEFVQADVSRLPFRHGEFDLVICLAVIEEVRDWRSMLQAMAQCVAPGGVLYVTMTNGKTLARLYTGVEKIGIRVRNGSRFYAQSSLRFVGSPGDGFGITGVRGWQFVNVTPHLIRANLPFLRVIPLSILTRIFTLFAPSFGFAWRRPAATRKPNS